MADSRTFRVQFWVQTTIFMLILVGILVVLSLPRFQSMISRYKLDMTQDGTYTISDSFSDILANLKDNVTVTYYVSEQEKMPSVLMNLRRDTEDMFEEIRVISNGRVRFRTEDPERQAEIFAREKVAEYKEAKAEGKEPEEPKPRQTIQDLFSGRQGQEKTNKEIAEQRRSQAAVLAKQSGEDVDDVFYTLLQEDWEENYIDTQEKKGIRPYTFRERQGSDIKQVSFYSVMQIEYKDKEPEMIPLYYELQSLELELATRILKLAQEVKPKVAFFDGREPPEPEFDPANPQQRPPMSDYASITQHLSQLFDVRKVKLEEGDTLQDLRVKIREEVKEEREKRGDTSEEGLDEAAKISCFIVAQPHDLNERQIYEVSKAVSEGIPTIFLVSRHSLAIDDGMERGYPIEFLRPGLEGYFSSLGLSLGKDLLASNLCSQLPAPIEISPGMSVRAAYPFSVTVMATAADGLLNEEAALINRVIGLVFPATNGITLKQEKLKELELETERLAWTGEETWSKNVLPFSTNQFRRGQPPSLFDNMDDLVRHKDPKKAAEEFIDRRELAVLLKGKFPFYYQGKEVPAWPVKEEPEEEAGPEGPGGPAGPQVEPGPDAAAGPPAPSPESAPAEETDTPAGPPQPAPSEAAAPPAPGSEETPAAEEPPKPEAKPLGEVEPKDGHVLVLASADFLKDRYFRLGRQFSDYQQNLQFFQNAVETFGLGDNLLRIRRKNITQHHFKDADEAKQAIIQLVSFAAVPLVIILLGLIRYILRQAEANAYERQQAAAGR